MISAELQQEMMRMCRIKRQLSIRQQAPECFGLPSNREPRQDCRLTCACREVFGSPSESDLVRFCTHMCVYACDHTCVCVWSTTKSHRSMSWCSSACSLQNSVYQHWCRTKFSKVAPQSSSTQHNFVEHVVKCFSACVHALYMCVCVPLGYRVEFGGVGGVGEWGKWGRSWSTCFADLTDRPVCAGSAGQTEGGSRGQGDTEWGSREGETQETAKIRRWRAGVMQWESLYNEDRKRVRTEQTVRQRKGRLPPFYLMWKETKQNH